MIDFVVLSGDGEEVKENPLKVAWQEQNTKSQME
jgi:hypothetical protein